MPVLRIAGLCMILLCAFELGCAPPTPDQQARTHLATCAICSGGNLCQEGMILIIRADESLRSPQLGR